MKNITYKKFGSEDGEEGAQVSVIPQEDGTVIFEEAIPEQVIPATVKRTPFDVSEKKAELEKVNEEIKDEKDYLVQLEERKTDLEENIAKAEEALAE